MHDRFPLPDVDFPGTAPFWAGAARRELLIPRCASCGAWCWYPRDACPACGSATFTWTPVSGCGRLFSWAVVHRPFLPAFADKVPFVPALVALDEDPSVRLVTEIVDASPHHLSVDQPVLVTFRTLSFTDVDGQVTAPFFAPA